LDCIDISLSQKCNILRPYKHFIIKFVSGSGVLLPGDFLKGLTSKQTGLIYEINLTSGAWDHGTAAGTIIITFLTGSLLDAETLQQVKESGSLASLTVSGTPKPKTDETGAVDVSYKSAEASCFFDYQNLTGAQAIFSGDGAGWFQKLSRSSSCFRLRIYSKGTLS
jgi:hypothetical protein